MYLLSLNITSISGYKKLSLVTQNQFNSSCHFQYHHSQLQHFVQIIGLIMLVHYFS